ncbi:MAG: peptidylprolyl isomerase [Pseudomonadota bacterium]
MNRLLKDPGVHFLAIALLTCGFYALSPQQTATESAQGQRRTVEISELEIERLSRAFARTAQRAPTARELDGIFANEVRRRVLAQEAIRLGLNQHDVIVERRLAQKMQSFLSDRTPIAEPSESDLLNWYEAHSEIYQLPDRWSIQHIFFSRSEERPSSVLKLRIADVKNQLSFAQGAAWQQLGDPSLLNKEYGLLPAREITRIFGGEFSKTIAMTAVDGAWHGPVHSAFGDHLVRIVEAESARLPSFDEVKERVVEDWRYATRNQLNEAEVARILNLYDVVLSER